MFLHRGGTFFYKQFRRLILLLKFQVFLYLIPILASIIPFTACKFFATPNGHGLFSFDIFLLLLMLLLPRGKALKKLVIAVVISVWGIYAETIQSIVISGLYVFMLFVTAFIPRNKKILSPAFFLFALLFVVAECGNFFYSSFMITLIDVWGLARFFWWGPIAYILTPLLLVFMLLPFAQKILWGKYRIEISHRKFFVTLVIVLAVNFGINTLQSKQRLVDFTTMDWCEILFTPGVVGQNTFLQEDIKAHLTQWDSSVNPVKDFSRPTIMIVVESWGVNKSVPYTDSLLAPYKGAEFAGITFRRAAFTQGAEWEDLDVSERGEIKLTAIPQKFRDNGLQTWFLHGYDSYFYGRQKDYPKYGFDSLLFRDDLHNRGLGECHYGYDGICDSSIVSYIDSLMTDSIPKFIFWTTLDGHPPYELAHVPGRSAACSALNLSEINCLHVTIQQNTARRIAALAARHPEYRFIIRGDHRPMASIENSGFVESFYFRWVPMVVIN